MASHSYEHLDRALAAFKDVGERLDLFLAKQPAVEAVPYSIVEPMR
jgi:hypothetical protein